MSLRCHLHGSVRNRPTVPAPRFSVVIEAYFFTADLMSELENLVHALLTTKPPLFFCNVILSIVSITIFTVCDKFGLALLSRISTVWLKLLLLSSSQLNWARASPSPGRTPITPSNVSQSFSDFYHTKKIISPCMHRVHLLQ